MTETYYKYVDEKDEYGKPQHLHTLRGKPLIGTTTFLEVLSKNLTWWAAECAAVECLEAGEKIPTIRAEYEEAAKSPDKKKAIDALQKKYPLFKKARFAHYDKKNDAAGKGTDLHAELEAYCKAMIQDEEGKPKLLSAYTSPQVKQFAEWAFLNVKRILASEGFCYSEKLWIGGSMDGVIEMNDGQIAVLDFKSAKDAYGSMFMQCASYAIQIEENGVLDENGNLLLRLEKPISLYAVIPFGSPKFKVEIKTNVEDYKRASEAALVIHKLIGIK